MNSKQNSQNMEEFSEEIEFDDSISIDDFIKELEEKEKDLHISSELIIEFEESEFNDSNVAETITSEISTADKKPPKTAAANMPTPNPNEINKFKNEILNLQSQVSKMEAQRAELVEMSRRRQTDFDNYKNRTERERSETFRNQLGNLAEQILPVLDNLNRALDSAAHFSGKDLPDFRQFCDGIVLVNQQLNEVLAGMGVQPIASVGEQFDPHFHEAVATEENENFPPHVITSELLRGYRIDDKIIRPAMVKVSKSRESRVESKKNFTQTDSRLSTLD